MFKIIWNHEDFKDLKSKLIEDYGLVLTQDLNDVAKQKIGVVFEAIHKDKIMHVLNLIAKEKSKLLFETQNGLMIVYAHEILFLEAFGDEIYVHFEHLESQILKTPLYHLENLLRPFNFIRIGKSYIVNLTKIRFIKTALNAKLTLELIDGTNLYVSRFFVKDFKYALGIREMED